MTDRHDPVLLCIGPSHKTATVAERERYALLGPEGARLVRELAADPNVVEIVSVATCNRSELYVVATEPEAVCASIVEGFSRLGDARGADMSGVLAVREGRAAAEHLLRVAAGVESVVIGEAQIQGQLRSAVAEARELGHVGPVLDRLFAAASIAGKRARTETQIGAGHASVGSVATEMVERRLGGLANKTVLLIGAGKMSTLTARTLAARGAGRVMVVNRNRENARLLADQCDGFALSFAELDQALVDADVVIASTAAPHAVLTVERMRGVVAARGSARPLVLVDLAVPRDIEAGVAQLDGCHLYDLDDLERVVSETLQVREGELAGAAVIVREELAAYEQWLGERRVGPAIARLRERAEAIRLREVARAMARLEHLSESDRARIERLSHSIVNQLLHEPMLRLRSGASRDPVGTDVDFAALTAALDHA